MLHQNTGKPAVFLTGGIGITPAPSLMRDMTPHKLTHALLLLDSNMRPKDAALLGPNSSPTRRVAVQLPQPACGWHVCATLTQAYSATPT